MPKVLETMLLHTLSVHLFQVYIARSFKVLKFPKIHIVITRVKKERKKKNLPRRCWNGKGTMVSSSVVYMRQLNNQSASSKDLHAFLKTDQFTSQISLLIHGTCEIEILESNRRRPSQLKTTHYFDENCMALEIWVFEKYDQ